MDINYYNNMQNMLDITSLLSLTRGSIFDVKLSGSGPSELEGLHFGNFVTARAAKSIISSKCVFNPSYGLPGVFKIKILYLDLILDHI